MIFVASILNIYIRSEGFNDPQKTSGRSSAYIVVNGNDHSPHFKRGHNVVTVDAKTGIKQRSHFQSWQIVCITHSMRQTSW